MPTPAESRDFLAEDVGLLPDHMFIAMLKASALTPDTFATNAALEWSESDPSILGTLFEITVRCGEPSTRSLPAVQPDPTRSHLRKLPFRMTLRASCRGCRLLHNPRQIFALAVSFAPSLAAVHRIGWKRRE